MECLGELHSLSPQNQKEITEAGENERKASDCCVVEGPLVERPRWRLWTAWGLFSCCSVTTKNRAWLVSRQVGWRFLSFFGSRDNLYKLWRCVCTAQTHLQHKLKGSSFTCKMNWKCRLCGPEESPNVELNIHKWRSMTYGNSMLHNNN